MPNRDTAERVERIINTPANDLQETKTQINALGQAFPDLIRNSNQFQNEVSNKLNELVRKVQRHSG
jgi:hypothetical protein